MPTKKKKFIDKKNSVTFHLVHRSQQDPLVADTDAPQHVLIPEASKKSTTRLEEQRKFGVYFDDEYNYLQHLKDVDVVPEWQRVVNRTRLNSRENAAVAQTEPITTTTDNPVNIQLQLPSSVFQSNVEESIGLLNKAAPNTGPHPDWDPDIVAALDDDFDFDDPENELPDDFIAMANDSSSEIIENEHHGLNMDDFSESDEEMYDECETKSQFTNYSMSSSILPRSEVLQTLDERFEKLFEEYNDCEVGSLEGEDLGGFINPDSHVMQQLLQDFSENKEQKTLKHIVDSKQRTLHFLESPIEELVDVVQEQQVKGNQWDCESVLSTYSNLYNRPKIITEKLDPVRVNEKTGLPKDVLRTGLTQKQLEKLDDLTVSQTSTKSVSSRISSMSCIRPKDETPEQRKERKKIIKEFRKERRTEKKANKEAFKEEAKRQEQVLRNLKQNLQGIKIV